MLQFNIQLLFLQEFIYEVDCLRQNAWKDFEEVKEDSIADNSFYNEGEITTLTKVRRIGEGKLFEAKIKISEELRSDTEFEDYDSDEQRQIREDAGLDDDSANGGDFYAGGDEDYNSDFDDENEDEYY